jgi:UMF1 family MFS transporter
MVDVEQGQVDAVRLAGIMKKSGGDDEIDGSDEGLQEAEGLMRDHD